MTKKKRGDQCAGGSHSAGGGKEETGSERKWGSHRRGLEGPEWTLKVTREIRAEDCHALT